IPLMVTLYVQNRRISTIHRRSYEMPSPTERNQDSSTLQEKTQNFISAKKMGLLYFKVAKPE
ncbi:hypothetical protein, partial [Ferrovum myxofaciens]|uniref:hypothetical protein n=1 Tax=Ferrovum myxofaciens TaxID=416213 RepID=UPI001F16068D